jgi:hypothetical protein
MRGQSDGDLFISSLAVAEIRAAFWTNQGQKCANGWKCGLPDRRVLSRYIKGGLSFDEKAALVWARLMSEGRAAGKPRGDVGMIFAAWAATGSVDTTLSLSSPISRNRSDSDIPMSSVCA